ncbi:Pyridoxal phosphate phosphatase YigL [Vibrio stylophorae]|uniref:Pyridoxal phosphate phosphatase YigL n=1 Tax=Vibrio stylophorae TaxID=659351 RepID=A0ABN8DQM9_9VIBR|nr:Cof-type HAD-IIB family hydrolase [Vibrio stylophorae]CAH0532286.1 Pyridoxal phosphate phosphatase YigL [Vibrio stylophorae]
MYKIIASDLDGTLLNQDRIIAPFTKSVLSELVAAGKIFVFATGRHYVDVANFRRELGLPAYMITSNGARVHGPDDEVVKQHDLLPQQVEPVVAIADGDDNIHIHIYTDQGWLISEDDPELRHFHDDSGFYYEVFDRHNLPTESVCKIFFISKDRSHEALLDLEKRLLATFGDDLAICFSTPNCLEVNAKGVSKGSALAEVAARHGCTLADCIAFGDGMNDEVMLASTGKGLIMADAHDRLKAALPNHEVIGSNKEEGVAQYLQAHFLK